MKKIVGLLLLISVLTLSACGAEVPGENLNEATKEVSEETAVEDTAEVASDEAAPEAAKEPEETSSNEEAPERQPATDFTMTSWQGEEITLSDYQGKIVFLNFFATWCPPCQEEMPIFQEASEKYEGDVVFQIIDVYSSERDGIQNVIDWYTEGGYTMPMIIDEADELAEFYPVRAFPTTFVIDRDGNVLGYLEGGMTAEMVDSIVAQADQ